MPNVGQAACSPVDAPVALHQLLVHEVAAKSREVRMAARDDPVDLNLYVPRAELEILHEPSQDDEPLLALGRNAGQAIPCIDEVRAYAGVVIGVMRCGHRGLSVRGPTP